MVTVIVVLVVVFVAGAAAFVARSQAVAKRREVDSAMTVARRWTERLGGQVTLLTGTDTASRQALADAAERLTAASAQLARAKTVEQAHLATDTALEGLYYIRAARTAMGLDPGPQLPGDVERERAGKVTENRTVNVGQHTVEASPAASAATPHYYPGGEVDGRQVPQGWYSQPWWQPALIGGAAGLGAALAFGSLFGGVGESGVEQRAEAGLLEAVDYAGFDDEF